MGNEAGRPPEASGSPPLASVVVPAHDEAGGIQRCLEALRKGGDPARLDVVIVCNGCTDDTAQRAREAWPEARVLELPTASKAAAVRAGNAASDVFPRVHLDADVQLSGGDVALLVAPLARGEVHATAPRRVIDREGAPRLVRWYYDVWEQLPQVRDGLFGRGAFALSATGQARVSALPDLLSDDLVASEAFGARQRRVVEEAVVVVTAPRATGDLLRRRVRVHTGNAQATSLGLRGAEAATSLRTLGHLALARPRLLPRLPVFLVVALLARVGSRPALRAGDFTTWQRDESSRA